MIEGGVNWKQILVKIDMVPVLKLFFKWDQGKKTSLKN